MKENRVLFVLFATLLLDMIGIGMLIPLIPALFTDAGSPSFLLAGYAEQSQYLIAGLITALFGFMQFIAAPILGELSDQYGRKKLLMIGVGVLAISNLVFATGILVKSLAIILLSRAIAGVAGANFSIAQAIIADITAPENRAKNFGLIGAAFGIGFILGPLLGGWLAALTGNPAVPFFAAGVLGVFNLLSVAFLLSETRIPSGESRGRVSLFKAFHHISEAYRDRDVRALYSVGFLSMFGFGFFTSFVSVFLVSKFGITETAVGTFFALVGVWVALSQGLLVRLLVTRYKERMLLASALFVLGCTILVQPFAPSMTYLYFVMPFMALSVALNSTIIPALISRGVSADRQGAALGINGSLQALSQALAPLISGFISGLIGITFSFVAGAAVIFLAWIIFINSRKRA